MAGIKETVSFGEREKGIAMRVKNGQRPAGFGC